MTLSHVGFTGTMLLASSLAMTEAPVTDSTAEPAEPAAASAAKTAPAPGSARKQGITVKVHRD
jgi:hypothetical protein